MNRIQNLITLRAEKLSALEAFSVAAATRGFTKEEAAQFDEKESEILALDADIAREKRAMALSAVVPVTPSAPVPPAVAADAGKPVTKELALAEFNKLSASEKLAHVKSGGTVAF
jgi:hypothetical protein